MSPNTTLAPSATSVRTCEAPIPSAPFPANRSATGISPIESAPEFVIVRVRTVGPLPVVEYAPGVQRRYVALRVLVIAGHHRVGVWPDPGWLDQGRMRVFDRHNLAAQVSHHRFLLTSNILRGCTNS